MLEMLETKRLTLRFFTTNDATRVQYLAGTEGVYATTLSVPSPYEKEMAIKWIETHQSDWEKKRGVNLAIELKDLGEIVGCVSLAINSHFNRAEIGYWIGEEFWNQGIATEAAKELVRFGFEELNLNKITSRHMEKNPSSGKIMQKIGMVQEGVLRQEIIKDGVYHDLVVYGLLKENY